MRPVMGAPNDTPEIHGLVDTVKDLQAKLSRAEKLLKRLQRVADNHAASNDLVGASTRLALAEYVSPSRERQP